MVFLPKKVHLTPVVLFLINVNIFKNIPEGLLKQPEANGSGLTFTAFLIPLLLASAGQYFLYFQKGFYPGIIFFCAAALVFAYVSRRMEPLYEPKISLKTELFFFSLILITAAFFRFYKISEIPAGCFPDEAQNVFDAAAIIKGSMPVYVGYSTHNAALYLYPAAFIFKLFGADVTQLRAYTALFGFLTVPALYFLLRSVLGPRAAIIGAFLLAVMRWHVNFNRIGYHASFALLMLVLVVYFVWKCRESKLSLFILLGLSLGIALNTYQSARLIPFWLGAVFIYVYLKDMSFVKKNLDSAVSALLLAFLIFIPLFIYAVTNSSEFFRRQAEVSIFNKSAVEGNLFYAGRSGSAVSIPGMILENTRDTLLMFHHKGDKNPKHNLPGKPVLDFVTGILFLLGFAAALSRINSPPNLLFLSAFGVFIIPGFITIEAPQSLRLFFLVPSAVYFCSLAAVNILKAAGRFKFAAYAVIALILVVSACENFSIYFNTQAKHPLCWHDFASDVHTAGKYVKKLGPEYSVILAAEAYKIRTFNLAASGKNEDRFTRFRIDQSAPIKNPDEGKKYVYMLNPHYKLLVPALFSVLYPGGASNAFFNRYNKKWLVYFSYEAGAEEIKNAALKFKNNGLILKRYPNNTFSGTPAESVSPVVFLDPDYGSVSQVWEGRIKIEEAGEYIFLTDSKGASEVYIDKKPVVKNAGGGMHRPAKASGMIKLEKGFHGIKVTHSQENTFSHMHLLWKKPGKPEELVPVNVLFHD